MTNTPYTFQNQRAYGRIGEGLCGRWLIYDGGWTLLPAYEIEIPSGKGPRLFTSGEQLIAPDIFAMKYQKRKLLCKWYEAKHKTRFTWYRKAQNWQTGIDLRHYLDYIKVQERTKIEVYLLFLHTCSLPSQYDLNYGSPTTCPIGLYGQTLNYLATHEHHRDSFERNERNYPMVYWNECDLERLATLEQVQTIQAPLWNGVPV